MREGARLEPEMQTPWNIPDYSFARGIGERRPAHDYVARQVLTTALALKPGVFLAPDALHQAADEIYEMLGGRFPVVE